MGPHETECPQCGFRNRGFDRRTYWNLAPVPRAVQAVLNALISILTLGLMALIAFGSPHMGRGAGYVIAAPLAVGVYLWACVRKITRHDPQFRPLLVLRLLLGVLAILLALVWIDGAAIPVAGRLTIASLMVLESALGTLAALGWAVAHRFERWKSDRLGRHAS